MPYNKGDFTQQGINGDVSALVRLNDKRVVKMVLSSDDESSNVDVTGTVYDYLNGETYPLGGTTPTGTITITENTEPGSPLDIAQYRYADVNVSGGGGGDTIPLCIMTVVASEMGGDDTPTRTFNDGRYEGIMLPDNTTTIIKNIYLNNDNPTTEYRVGFFCNYDLQEQISDPANVSDLVNLTLDVDGYLIVTDPTIDSSCTITANEFSLR